MRELIAALVLAAGTAASAAASPPEFCGSAVFREAFLDGLVGLFDDDPGASPELIGMGDRALPCLAIIAERGAGAVGFDECRERPNRCEAWALGSIRRIATPAARRYLIEYAGGPTRPHLTGFAVRLLGSLRETGARSMLRGFLVHEDPTLRAESVGALGSIGNPADYDAMLETTLALPDEQLYDALHGFRNLGDPRALTPLEVRAESVQDPGLRKAILGSIESWRSRMAAESSLAADLRGEGSVLFEAIRRARRYGSEDPEVRDALLQLLEHRSAYVRAETILTLGILGNRSNFEALLAATLALPDDRLATGALGLRLLGDPRAVEPVLRRAETIKRDDRRRAVERWILGLRPQVASERTD